MIADPGKPDDHLRFLCVDAFISNLVHAQALKSALDLGLIDQLQTETGGSLARIQERWSGDSAGLDLLLDLLNASGVITRSAAQLRLTPRFLEALPFRDLLEAKLEFANHVAPDLIQLFAALIADPARFMREARIFHLFGYHRCFERTPENHQATSQWMRFTTVLTRYEARACMMLHDFKPYSRILDIGGNSGELVLQLCKRHPRLEATVFDLPVVCDVGYDHIRKEPEAARITFQMGNALVDRLPTGFDAVIFKSMLHDWPDDEATRFIANASRCLNPGGRILIFERARFESGSDPVPYAMIPMLLFFRSFRAPSFYQEKLEQLGFFDITIQMIQLEMPFFLISGRSAGQPRHVGDSNPSANYVFNA